MTPFLEKVFGINLKIIIDIYKHCSPVLGAGDREFKSLYSDTRITPVIPQ